MAGKNLITASGLSVSYRIGRGLFSQTVLKAVNNVSLNIEQGSFFGLVGNLVPARRHWGARFSMLFRSATDLHITMMVRSPLT